MALNARLRKNRRGSIGELARFSQATNAATRTAPPSSDASTVVLVHPSALARTRPKTTPKRPALARSRPGRSTRPAGPKLSERRIRARGATASPMGTLSQKIQCHEMPPTTAPPTTGPRATPSPLMPDQMPSATPRRPAGNASDRRVSVNGVTSAPPAPWRARAPINAPMLGASAAAAEPSVKMANPKLNMRRLPNRSPSAAPVRSSTAKLSV